MILSLKIKKWGPDHQKQDHEYTLSLKITQSTINVLAIIAFDNNPNHGI